MQKFEHPIIMLVNHKSIDTCYFLNIFIFVISTFFYQVYFSQFLCMAFFYFFLPFKFCEQMKEVENPKYLGQLEPKWSTPQMPSPTQCHFQGLPYPLIEGSLLLLDAPFLILGSTGTSQQVAVQ